LTLKHAAPANWFSVGDEAVVSSNAAVIMSSTRR
jgi:hypothetical protein